MMMAKHYKGLGYSTKHVKQNYIDRKNGMKPQPKDNSPEWFVIWFKMMFPLFTYPTVLFTCFEQYFNFFTVWGGLVIAYYLWFKLLGLLHKAKRQEEEE